jgi:hypothetical protein
MIMPDFFAPARGSISRRQNSNPGEIFEASITLHSFEWRTMYDGTRWEGQFMSNHLPIKTLDAPWLPTSQVKGEEGQT